MGSVIDLDQYKLRKAREMLEEAESEQVWLVDEFEMHLIEQLAELDAKLDEINLNQVKLEKKLIDFIESFNELMRD